MHATFVIADGLKRVGDTAADKLDGIPSEAVVMIDGVEFGVLMTIFPHTWDPAVMAKLCPNLSGAPG